MINFAELLWSPRSRRDPSRGRVETPAAVEDVQELNSVAVEHVKGPAMHKVAVHAAPESMAADRFRLLRMRLRELRAAAPVRSVLITSPQPKDGKSTVALNLAAALAEGGKRAVLLLEADMHRPSLCSELGIPQGPGLASCLEEGEPLIRTLRKLEPLGFYLLSAGHPSSNPSELLQGNRLEELMAALAAYFDWIVIDSPPVNLLADTIALTRVADTSLLVVRAGETPKEGVEQACETIGVKNLLGIVLNGAEASSSVYRKYAGYYRE